MDSERKSPNATLEESARFLKVSPRSVLNYVDRELITPVYMGKRRLFRWADLEKLARRGVPLEPKHEQRAQ